MTKENKNIEEKKYTKSHPMRQIGKSYEQMMMLYEKIKEANDYIVFKSISGTVHIMPEKTLQQHEEEVRREERERIAKTPIIQEFIESTKIWYEELAPVFRKGKCIMCGRIIEKQKELCDALQALITK